MSRRKIEHRLFLLSVWSKGIAGLVETIGGLILLCIPKAGLNALVIFLTAPELAEDPTDRVATLLQRIVHELAADTKLFASGYLIVHGLIKIFLVAGLLRHGSGRTRLFANSCFYLEEIHRRTRGATVADDGAKNPVMVAAGKKAAETRATAVYDYLDRVAGKPKHIADLAQQIREFIAGLDTGIEEVPKKFYVAYKSTQNIVCMEIQKQQILLYLKLDPKTIPNPPPIVRDVSNIGHFGTGDTEVTIRSEADLLTAKPLIEQAYRQVGG